MKSTRAFEIVFMLALAGVVVLLILSQLRGPREPETPAVKAQMDSLSLAMREFESTYSRYPGGTKSEILQALTGNNPRRISFLAIAPQSTNVNGQFVDPWGMPYEIELVESNRFKIRSAGQNKSLGDEDDWIMNVPEDRN